MKVNFGNQLQKRSGKADVNYPTSCLQKTPARVVDATSSGGDWIGALISNFVLVL